MDNKQVFTRITKRVTLEKQLFTYRLCSRELGLVVKDAKAVLAAYLDTEQAKERGVSAVYLLSGSLKQEGKGKKAENASGMDVDGGDGMDSSQQREEDEAAEDIKVRTVKLVPAADLEAQTALFSSPPTIHVYALTPTPLTTAQLSLLSTSSLSLVSSANRDKWKTLSTEDSEGYGGIRYPDGVRKRKPGEGARGGATSAAKPAAAGSSKAATVKKEEDKKPAPGAKGKQVEKKKPEPKKKATGPKIGQLRGLFSKSFDEPAPSKKGKKKADSSDEDEEDEEESEEQEDVKPAKKTIPAKRKSSPTVPRSNSTSRASSSKPTPAPSKTAPPKKEDVDMTLDDDDDWAMDEEALMEAERAAQKQADEKAKAKAGGGGATDKSNAKGKGTETEAERQRRELEEMMNEDAMDVDEKKPVTKKTAPALSRNSSSSSSVNKGKPASSSSSSSAKPKAGSSGGAVKKQGSLNAFFGKK
ncbi:hypothetical protein JCM11251_004941 [Rhodosporidiobolus azoricus]